MSLDAYAAALALPAAALRALLTAQPDQVAPELVTRLAAAHGQDAAAGLAALGEAPAGESFGDWLGRNMEGVSQTSLRTRARLDAPLLRAFLSGKTIPDADQAERIARALYVDSAEMAGVIVADMARRAAALPGAPAQHRGATATPGADERAATAPEPARPDAPAPARARRRQARDSSHAAPAPAPAGPPEHLTAPPQAPALSEAGDARADQPPQAAGAAEPASGRRRRAAASAPAAPAATPATTPPAGEGAVSAEQAVAAQAGPPTSAEADTPRAPARRKGRQPAGAAEPPPAAASDAPGEEAALAAGAAGPSPAAPAGMPGEEVAAQAARAPRRAGRVAAAASDEPVAAGATAGAARAARKRAGAQPAALADSGEGEAVGGLHTGAEMGAPEQARTAAGSTAEPPPTVAAAVRSIETTLQLSPDEVRLIRSWRRLHPQGQRATFQYIGALLVEE